MNIETIKYISKIAGFAMDQLKSGKTLKASKAWLADAMAEATTPYIHHDDVNFEVVNARRSLNDAVDARTKAVFICQCKNALAWAAKHYDDAVMAKRVDHAIASAAKRHGVVIHAADVIEWAAGDIYFNFTKAADALAEAAKAAPAELSEAEVMQITFYGANDYAARRAIVEAAHAEALAMNEPAEPMQITVAGSVGVNNPFHKGDVVYVGRIDSMPATVDKLPKVGDVIEAYYWMDKANVSVKVREVLNDCPPRPAHLQAARDAHHDELFSGFFNDRPKPTLERKRQLEDMADHEIYVAFAAPAEEQAPAPVAGRGHYRKRLTNAVKIIGKSKGETTYRVKLTNGRTYLYTAGYNYAQVKGRGGKLREVKNPDTLHRLREAIKQA